MSHSSRLKNWLLIFAIACLLASTGGETVSADGSWGSSRGGWGSGGSRGSGSYGCRGGLFSNQPVRNLLSRVGTGVGNGISMVGDGISNIFERRSYRSGMSGGSNGSNGGSGGWGSRGSYGSTGSNGGWGSSGGWGCSGGMVSVPQWSPPAYTSAPICDTGCVAMGSGVPMIEAQSYGFAGSSSAYIDPAPVGMVTSQYETSAPMLDYGYYGGHVGQIGIPTDATMIGGSMITGPMMQSTPMLMQSDGSIGMPPGTSDLPGNGYYDGNTEQPPEDPFGAEDDDDTAEDDDDSAYMPRGRAVLSLDVPRDAKVYINDKLTQTSGTQRSYVSRNLVRGQEYRYRVKVVSDVEGKEVVKSRVVTMRGGESNEVAFNFNPIVTRVVVSVPDDAKVIIDGKETSTAGTYRSFSTEKLKSGKWDDYSVVVSVVRDGKTLTRKENFDLAAGEFRFFQFDFDKASAGSVAKK